MDIIFSGKRGTRMKNGEMKERYVDGLEAGPELDRLIKEKLMDKVASSSVLPYSSEVGEAWKVIERLIEKGYKWLAVDQFYKSEQEMWRAYAWTGGEEEDTCSWGDAETVSLAICRMAIDTLREHS